MSAMVYIKAVRLKIDKTFIEMEFDNPKYPNCKDELPEYLERFKDLVGYHKPGKFSYAYGVGGTYSTGYHSEYYIDFVLDYDYDSEWPEFGRSRYLSNNELMKYITKFQEFFEIVKLPLPKINKDTLRVVEYCYYNGADVPACFDIEPDTFYEEV